MALDGNQFRPRYGFVLDTPLLLPFVAVCNVLASRLSGDRKAHVDDGMQPIYGVGLLIVLLNLIGVAAAALLTIHRP